MLAFRLTPEEDANPEEECRNPRIRKPHAQRAVVHAHRGVEKPDRRSQKPDPVEMLAHKFWDAPIPLLRNQDRAKPAPLR